MLFFIGFEVVLTLFYTILHHSHWVNESDVKTLRNQIKNILEICDFEPQGYTCLWLLGKSHLAIHTYSEHNKAYIELTSCVLSKNQLFDQLLPERFIVD